MRFLLLIACLIIPYEGFADETEAKEVNPGEVWILKSTSGNGMMNGGEVLYLMPNNAYETYRSRRFDDWNQFSIVDTRNLVKLRRGYEVEILEGLYQNDIYKVKLLSGNNKGRKYFVITEDLLKKYNLKEEEKWRILYYLY